MAEAMYAASGISPGRARRVARQAKTSLLGDALNFPVPHIDAAVLGVPDLGEGFRQPVTSDVPTLFMSGTLDGCTYPESAAGIASRFSRATRLIAENGGHNVLEADPAIGAAVVTFLQAKPLGTTIRLPPPKFPH
jgi:pimeloyl-ACP methyl ester carboxylesterase